MTTYDERIATSTMSRDDARKIIIRARVHQKRLMAAAEMVIELRPPQDDPGDTCLLKRSDLTWE